MLLQIKKEKLSTYKTPIKESNFSNKLNIKSKAIKPMEKMKTNNILSERIDKKKRKYLIKKEIIQILKKKYYYQKMQQKKQNLK